MEHYRSLYPGEMYEVQYEEFVSDNEAQIRKLLDFCGLEFHPGCVSFHETERIVKTASSRQVKKPVYKSSVDRWRRYEEYLDPLIEAIGKDKLIELGVDV